MSKIATAAILAAAVPVMPVPSYRVFGHGIHFAPPAAPGVAQGGPLPGAATPPANPAAAGPGAAQAGGVVQGGDMRAEFTRLQTEANALIDTATRENRGFTDAERTAQEGRFTRLCQIRDVQAEALRFQGLTLANVPGLAQAAGAAAAGAAAAAGIGAGTPAAAGAAAAQFVLAAAAPGNLNAAEFARMEADNRLFTANPDALTEADQVRYFALYRDALKHFVKTGERSRAGLFTLTTATGGGVMVPTTVATPVVVKRIPNGIRAALVARGLTPLRTTTAEPIKIPLLDDTGNVADVIAENATGDNPKDPAASLFLTLGVNEYDSGTTWYSLVLLLSVDFDISGILGVMLDKRIDAKQSAAWFTLLKAATVGVTAPANGLTYQNLVGLQYSIPLVKRENCVFFASDGVMRTLAGMTDTTGRPLYLDSMRDDTPNTLLGWPIVVTDQLPDIGPNAVSMIAAAMSGVYIRDIGGTIVERYIGESGHPGQTGIRKLKLGDFAFDGGAVRTLKHAAS